MLIQCRECGIQTCHVPDDAGDGLKQYDGYCPKCAMIEAVRRGDTSIIEALTEIVGASLRIAVEIVNVEDDEDDEDVTAESIYVRIIDFLRRNPALRKRLLYDLQNAEIAITPVTHNDPRYG